MKEKPLFKRIVGRLFTEPLNLGVWTTPEILRKGKEAANGPTTQSAQITIFEGTLDKK